MYSYAITRRCRLVTIDRSLSSLPETHSTTEDNEVGVATGWLPGRLSALGREQAAEVGKRRADDGIAAVFSSDLARATQTAAIAFAGTGIPVLLDWRLRECDYGDAQRLTRRRAARAPPRTCSTGRIQAARAGGRRRTASAASSPTSVAVVRSARPGHRARRDPVGTGPPAARHDAGGTWRGATSTGSRAGSTRPPESGRARTLMGERYYRW